MAALDPILVVVGALLLFYLPGFLFLATIFPRRRWFGTYHAIALPTLSVVTSVAILILVGSVLGALPARSDGRGWFQGRTTGDPILEIVLATLSLALFVAAWIRGAFPLLRLRHDLSAEPERRDWQERGEPEDVTRLRDLRLEEERLRQESRRVRMRGRESRDMTVRRALFEAAAELELDRREVASRARHIEREAGERRYGDAKGRKAPPR